MVNRAPNMKWAAFRALRVNGYRGDLLESQGTAALPAERSVRITNDIFGVAASSTFVHCFHTTIHLRPPR